jgi:hypothetical protein
MQRTFLHPGQEDDPLQLPRACESGVNGVHQEVHECLYKDEHTKHNYSLLDPSGPSVLLKTGFRSQKSRGVFIHCKHNGKSIKVYLDTQLAPSYGRSGSLEYIREPVVCIGVW